MPKKFLARYLPKPHVIKNNKSLRFLGKRLHDPSLWHLNRKSFAGAAFIGLFCAFLPIPFQMPIAAITSIILRVNLPLSAMLVWLSNPFTQIPIFYFFYKIGSFLLGIPTQPLHIELSWDWFTGVMLPLWKPFLLGSLVCSFFFGSLGYFLAHAIWRIAVTLSWRRRLAKRKPTRV